MMPKLLFLDNVRRSFELFQEHDITHVHFPQQVNPIKSQSNSHLFSSDNGNPSGGGVGAGGIESVGDESSRLSSSILLSIALMLSIESLSQFLPRLS